MPYWNFSLSWCFDLCTCRGGHYWNINRTRTLPLLDFTLTSIELRTGPWLEQGYDSLSKSLNAESRIKEFLWLSFGRKSRLNDEKNPLTTCKRKTQNISTSFECENVLNVFTIFAKILWFGDIFCLVWYILWSSSGFPASKIMCDIVFYS